MQIEALNPIKWISVRRNEVGVGTSTHNTGLYIEDERQQRARLFLRDVAYRIHGFFELLPTAGANNSMGKFLDIFERRAEKGQCVNQPYLGCREFAAAFKLVDTDSRNSPPIDDTRDLGWMFYDR